MPKIIEKFGKTSGPDLLHPVLRETKPAIFTPLKYILKHSYLDGEVVDHWKTAHVKALIEMDQAKKMHIIVFISLILYNVLNDGKTNKMKLG